MSFTVRLDLDRDRIEFGNEEIGFGKFDATSRDIAWARRLAEFLEEQGIDVEIEESDG